MKSEVKEEKEYQNASPNSYILLRMVVDLIAMLPRKRQKLHNAPKMEDYAAGNIIRCKMANFMSYSLTEFHCNPHMNLIIGPNGSGKSTFVCAVCIGLGGKVAYLGKETMTVDQFIKEGETNGYIELELKASDDDVNNGKMSTIIKRELNKGSASVWTVDGTQFTERQTKKMLQSYNIQLDNLCQFLPQDRVSKFGDLKPEELLKEIERSYKDGQLLEQHEKLCNLYQDVQSQKKDLEDKVESLQTLKLKNKELEGKAEKHKEYMKLQNEINRMAMVKPFFKLESLMDAKRKAKVRVRDHEKEKESFISHFQQFYDELNNTNANANANEREINQLKRKISELKDLEKEIEEKLVDRNKVIGNKLKKVEELQSHRSKITTKIKSNNETLQTYEEHREKIQLVPDEEFKSLNEKQVSFSSEQRDISAKKSEISDDISRQRRQIQKLEMEISNRQKKLASTDRLDQLDTRRFNDLIRALKFLRASENSFEYFEPPLLTINVQRDVSYAFDQIIPNNIKNSFVVKDLDNFRRLTDALFDQAKIRASVRSLTNNTHFEPKVSRDVITKFGFDGYLVDFVTGPSEVIQMLCDNTHMHEIPISIKGLDSKTVEQFQEWNTNHNNVIVKFIVGDHIYTSNKSRYGKRQVNLIGSTIQRRPNLFTGGISEEQKNLLSSEIEGFNTQISQANEKLQASQSQELEFSRLYATLKDKSEDIRKSFLEERAKRNKHEKYCLKIDEIKEKILNLENELNSVDSVNSDSSKRDEILDEISKLEDEKITLVSEYVSCTKERMEKEMGLNEWSIKHEQQQLKANRLKNISEYLEKKTKEFENDITKLKAHEKLANQEYNKFKHDYTENISTYTPEEKQSMKEYITSLKEEFNSDENHDEDDRAAQLEAIIEKEVTKMKSKLALVGASGNAEAIELLEVNRGKLQKLETSIPQLESVRDETETELKSIHDEWKPELEKIIQIVDADFGSNMRVVASGGGVTLDDSIPDYNKWKLVIKVSFRDAEELTQFNGAQHSGGEKSTTTAVFLNSLQGLTNTPFRIVDEINQGMDAKNERNAHKLIVTRATDPNINASQYFLITPKLLTDLHYSERMSIHCIFAGKWTPMFKDNVSFLEMGESKNYMSTF